MKNNYTLQKKLRISLFLMLLIVSRNVNSQIGINTTTPKAALDIVAANEGMLISRVALNFTNSLNINIFPETLATPTASELVYNTATTPGPNGVTPGYYYLNDTANGWIRLGSDNLGNHVATQTLVMGNNPIHNAGAIGIGTSTPAAALDINSANNGVLIPRVALLSTGSLSTSSGSFNTPTVSELVYNTATVGDVTPGFYYLNSTANGWIRLLTGADIATSGDNLGNHTAAQPLNMNGNNVTNANMVQATSNLSLNPTSGNVGIGTNAPAQKLTVAGGNIGLDNQGLIVAKNSGGAIYENVLYGRWLNNATYLDGGTGGTYLRTNNGTVENQFLSVNGSTGIGTATPQKRLHVNGNLQVTNEINVGGNATTPGTAGISGQFLKSNGPGAAPT